MLSKHKILIVDDDEDIHFILNKILNKDGIQTLNASNVEEAVRIAEKHIPSLILSDINMTPLNGFDFLKYLRQKQSLSFIPVIMLSSKNDKDSVFKCIHLGAKDYILKPVNDLTVLSKVRKYFQISKSDKYVFSNPEKINVLIDAKIKSFSKNIIKFDNRNYFKTGHIINLDLQSHDKKHRCLLKCLITEEPKKIFFNNQFAYELIPLVNNDHFENFKKQLGIYGKT